MEYKGCYLNDFGQKQIVYGDNAANALGGNGYIGQADSTGPLQSYSYNLNTQICNMVKKVFNCPNGEQFGFPAGAYDLKNWKVGGFYIGIETQDAFAQNMNSIPTIRGASRGNIALGVQISDLKLIRYPQEESSLCAGMPNGMICSPGSRKSCDIANGVGAQTCSSDGASQSICMPISCNDGFALDNGACSEILSSDYSSGAFCSTTHQILWQCGRRTSPGTGWMDQGNHCFQKDNGLNSICK